MRPPASFLAIAPLATASAMSKQALKLKGIDKCRVKCRRLIV